MEWVSIADLLIVGGITVLAYLGNRKINKQTEVLNELQIARERREANAEKEANLSADLHQKDKAQWQLGISNEGATAYHVDIEFPEGHDDIPIETLSKFPLEVFESGQSVNLPVYRTLSSRMTKIPIRLTWRNIDGEARKKDLIPTF